MTANVPCSFHLDALVQGAVRDDAELVGAVVGSEVVEFHASGSL